MCSAIFKLVDIYSILKGVSLKCQRFVEVWLELVLLLHFCRNNLKTASLLL